MRLLRFPEGRLCAFGITDDADGATLEKVRIVYGFLDSLGMRSSRSVWVRPASRRSGNPESTGKACRGATLEDPAYLALVRSIRDAGHEICYHLASGGNNTRGENESALEFMRRELGSCPRLLINHGRNADAMYWGRSILGGGLPGLIARIYCSDRSEGEIPGSQWFWGDLCRRHIAYVRHLKSAEIDNLRLNPSMPYHLPGRPYVNRWFSCTDLSKPWLVRRILTPKAVDGLVRGRGACVAYAYLHDFVMPDGSIEPSFRRAAELLAGTPGCWSAPVSDILDRLESMRRVSLAMVDGTCTISNGGSEAVDDVWVEGAPGEVLATAGGEKLVIGESGRLRVGSVEASAGGDGYGSEPVPGRREMAGIILGQIRLLALRHAHGRKFRRKGWS